MSLFPLEQLKILFVRGFHGFVICTLIQTMVGGLNKELLLDLGYTESMIRKVYTLLSKNALEKFLSWLNANGVKEVFGYFLYRKSYFAFKC